jgi:hypothetical protein
MGASRLGRTLCQTIRVLAAWHLRYALMPNSLEPLPLSPAYVVQPEPAWCLRYAPDTNLAFASSGTASHGAVLGVEFEQSPEGKVHTDRNVLVVRPTQPIERTETANTAVPARSSASAFGVGFVQERGSKTATTERLVGIHAS